jgi:SRSO17 transposase
MAVAVNPSEARKTIRALIDNAWAVFLLRVLHSVGVKRQYTGAAGRIENSQVGVFLCCSGRDGAALVHRELYLPEEWAADAERRLRAQVPEATEFATKPELANARSMQAPKRAGWP